MMFYAQYLVLFVAIIAFELLRNKPFVFDFLTFANLFFLLGYVITPVYLYYYSLNGIFFGRIDEILWVTGLAYFCLAAGWVLKGGLRSYNRETNVANIYKIVTIFSFLTLFVGSLYITGKGGIVNLLASGALVRYGFEQSSSTAVDFLANVFSMAGIVTYLLFAMLLSPDYREYHRRLRFYYIAILAFFLAYVWSTSSRGGIANVFILHAVIYWYYNRSARSVLQTIITGFPFLIVLILYGKQAFFALGSMLRGESFVESFIYLNAIRQTAPQTGLPLYGVMREYQHSTQSLGMAFIAIEHTEYTYFRDFALSLLRIIPQRLTMQFYEIPSTISRMNTYLLSNLDVASTPPGLIAHFYYSFGLLGVVAGSFIYGFMGRSLNNYLLGLFQNNDLYFVFYILLGYTFGTFIANGDPNVYFYSVLWPFVILYITAIIGKPREGRYLSGREGKNRRIVTIDAIVKYG